MVCPECGLVVKDSNTAETTAARKDISTIDQAITIYRLETGDFPESIRDLVKEPDDVRRWNGPYLRQSVEVADLLLMSEDLREHPTNPLGTGVNYPVRSLGSASEIDSGL